MKKMLETSRLCCISFFLLSAMFACQDDEMLNFLASKDWIPSMKVLLQSFLMDFMIIGVKVILWKKCRVL